MKKFIIFAVAAFAVSFLVIKSGEEILHETSTTEFCVSCHSMEIPAEEFESTAHFSNSFGVRVECKDCHINEYDMIDYVKAKLGGAKDIWYELTGEIDTPEKYEEHRLEMAQAVWATMEANNSATCKHCHSYDSMNWDEMSVSAKTAMMPAAKKDQGCIDCHKGIAHHLPKVQSDSTALSKLEINETVYTTTTSTIYNEKSLPDKSRAKMLPLTKLTLLEKDEKAFKVKLSGWQEGRKKLLYAEKGLRITDATLRGIKDIKETGETYYDDATKKDWKGIEVIAWIGDTQIIQDLGTEYEGLAFQYDAKCGACHTKVEESHFKANDWPAQFKGMSRQAKLEKNESYKLLKYLQYHSADFASNH